MKFIDLFAGIGGMRLGMEQAGHECVGFCEFDKYAVASYTSMHLITDEQREYLATLPLKKRQKEILKEEYRNGELYFNDIRTVKVFDVNGNIIYQYDGKIDIEYDECRILFDDEEGKRHVIYYTTGTVLIEETGE